MDDRSGVATLYIISFHPHGDPTRRIQLVSILQMKPLEL